MFKRHWSWPQLTPLSADLPPSLALLGWAAGVAAAYLLLNASAISPLDSALWRSGQHLRVVLSLLLYALTGVGLGALLASLNRYLALLACLLMLAGITTNHLAVRLLDLKVLDQSSAEWLLSETGETGDAVRQFSTAFTMQLAVSSVVLVPLVVIARFSRRQLLTLMRPATLAVGALLVYGLGTLSLYRYFNPYLPTESNLALYRVKVALRPDPDIAPVDLAAVQGSPLIKTVLVVDESVNYHAYVSQLKDRWKSWNPIDFGEAVSLGNCSASSNGMLRWGFRAKSMLAGADPRRGPTIWSYARAAGYQTIFIDGQRHGSFQNYMNDKEAALIDRIIGVDAGIDTDKAIATLLRKLLLEPGRMFIYINKRGDHFPYAQNLPRKPLPASATTQQLYYAGVKYSTADFFDTALQKVPLRDTLLIYTSDHGEQFGPGSPHCNPVPTVQETSVPLLLFTADPRLSSAARAAVPVLRNRVGHEQIFSTLLAAMGYDLSAAEAESGSSLLSPSIPLVYYHVSAVPIPSKHGARTIREFRRFPPKALEPQRPAPIPVD